MHRHDRIAPPGAEGAGRPALVSWGVAVGLHGLVVAGLLAIPTRDAPPEMDTSLSATIIFATPEPAAPAAEATEAAEAPPTPQPAAPAAEASEVAEAPPTPEPAAPEPPPPPPPEPPPTEPPPPPPPEPPPPPPPEPPPTEPPPPPPPEPPPTEPPPPPPPEPPPTPPEPPPPEPPPPPPPPAPPPPAPPPPPRPAPPRPRPAQPAAAKAVIPAVAPGPMVAAPAPAALIPDQGPNWQASALNNPKPSYPPAALRQGIEGRVLVRVLVDANGQPAAVELAESSGSRLLDDAALETLRRWRFQPARRNGVAVAQEVRVPINFKLQSAQR